MSSFIRYPGGKRKMMPLIERRVSRLIEGMEALEYREPFFGGGGVGISLLSGVLLWKAKSVWVNDRDPGLSCLWTSVMRHPEALKGHVRSFKPSVEAFDEFQRTLRQEPPEGEEARVEFGFQKLALHQISYSGLGLKSGGPLGGRDQRSKYPIDCRWSPEHLCRGIDRVHSLFAGKRVHENRCTSDDFQALLEGAGEDVFVYLDPPYYDKGGDLYEFAFQEADHDRLAQALKGTKARWLLSYDDCPEVRDLYEGWARVETTELIGYSITARKDRQTGKKESRALPELLISPSLGVDEHDEADVFALLAGGM